MNKLIKLAERCEKAKGPTKVLDREIALAVGWVRLTPGSKHPAWFHPDDCRDGKVIYDSLHGTDVWRDPLAYTASLDAAMTLVPEEFGRPSAFTIQRSRNFGCCAVVWVNSEFNRSVRGDAATPELALCAAALRAHRQDTNWRER